MISPFEGVVELDESYFEARRVSGRGGRAAAGKTRKNVYTEIILDCSKATLQGIIRGRVFQLSYSSNVDEFIHTENITGNTTKIHKKYYMANILCD